MTSKYNQDLSSERIQNSSGIDFDDIQCSICGSILWKPVACQSCETPFCSTCIAKWIQYNPGKCPIKCDQYIERSCPRFILRQLSKLQIDCIYKSHGCNEIVPYEALEKHQAQCDYQTQTCPGCQSQITKISFNQHIIQCISIEITCRECQLVFNRGEINERHTNVVCLKEQLRQVRQISEENKQKFEKQSEEYNCEIQKLRQNNDEYARQIKKIEDYLLPKHITFADVSNVYEYADIPVGYKNLEWTGFKCSSKAHQNQNYGCILTYTNNNSDFVASSSGDSSISIRRSNMLFDIISLDIIVPGSWNFQITITGYQKSTFTKTHTSTCLGPGLLHIDLNWTDIDELKFYSSNHFLLTDLVLNRSF